MQHLECDDTVMFAILGQVYRRHATAAELAVDGVGICKRGSQPLDGECQVLSSGKDYQLRKARISENGVKAAERET